MTIVYLVAACHECLCEELADPGSSESSEEIATGLRPEVCTQSMRVFWTEAQDGLLVFLGMKTFM